MKIKLYRWFYITFLILSLLITISFLSLSLYLAVQGEGEGADNIMFSVCFLILALFISFQIYSIFHSFKNGSVLFKNIISNDGKEISKASLITANVFLILGLAGLIYAILLASGMEIPLNGFPLALDYLIISCCILLIVNLVFFNLYTLVYKQDN